MFNAWDVGLNRMVGDPHCPGGSCLSSSAGFVATLAFQVLQPGLQLRVEGLGFRVGCGLV